MSTSQGCICFGGVQAKAQLEGVRTILHAHREPCLRRKLGRLRPLPKQKQLTRVSDNENVSQTCAMAKYKLSCRIPAANPIWAPLGDVL
eukprot:507401-Amphidinium_carterae.1